MRILYVTNGFPYPLTSGYLRHYFLIKELSQQHQITLLSITAPRFEAEHAEALAPFTERVLTFASAGKRNFRAQAVKRLRSLAGRDRTVAEMCSAVEKLTARERFGVALLSGKQTFPVIERLAGLPLVIDMCDAASMNIRGRMRYASLGRRALLLLDYIKMRRVESGLIRRASHLLFASCRDREALLGRQSSHATVVPNGINTDFWKRSSRARGTDTVVFTGAMNYPPNVDAALYLIERVLPALKQAIPDAKLLIVGRDPTPRLTEAGRHPDVCVTGFVDDVRPYLERAAVFAAPLRFGAGIQNKVLEAMAMEVPVIASPLAADGLRTEAGACPPIQIARTLREMVEMLTRRLIETRHNPSPDAEARHFVERHFIWQSSGARLGEIISNVAKTAEV